MAVKRTTPLKNVRKRNPDIVAELGTANSNFAGFNDNQYSYGKLPPLPQNDGSYTFHQYPNGWKHASLALGNGQGATQPATKFEFWVTDVTFGYGSGGQEAQSAFYTAYYARAFNRMPVQIKGRVPTEKYKEDMQLWIRDAQIRMARGEPRIFLNIPAADIHAWGYIPSFAAGQEQGFEPAPEISFDFVVTRDTRTDRKGAISQQVIAYFLDPQDKYWRKQSQIFVDTAYDAYKSELEQDKKAAQDDLAKDVKGFFDFFERSVDNAQDDVRDAAGNLISGVTNLTGLAAATAARNRLARIFRKP